MRKAMLLLAVFALVGLLWAADPSVGTWKRNIAKSKFAPSTQAAVKEQTYVIREVGDQWELATKTTRMDGSSTSVTYTRPKQGGTVKAQPPLSGGQSYIDTVIEPGNWYLTVLQDGKQISVTHGLVSKDGKTMNMTTKSTNTQGKPSETLGVFNKQ